MTGLAFRAIKFAVTVFLATVVLTGCRSASQSAAPSIRAPTSAPSASPASAAIRIVALGDSDTTGAGDPTGAGWVGRYGELVQRNLGVDVRVTNLAAEGETSDQLLDEVRSDDATQQELADADVVLIGIGGADLNEGDADLEAGSCTGRACYTPVLYRFGKNFQDIVAAVRASAPPAALLRAITLANVAPGAARVIPSFLTPDLGLYQAATERDAICDAMQKYKGKCIDVLTAFNGRSGMEDAYASGLMNKEECCYPSGKGQQLIAELLVKSGLPSGEST
jgi:lysophospholipase L1-like esterase